MTSILITHPLYFYYRFDSTSALDFLWACMHIPKIWQGRDKKPPKNYTPEDVLQLSTEQISVSVADNKVFEY